MNALIVTESCFGNTARLGEAVAAGLRSQGATVDVTGAASAAIGGVDLLVLGAPTHNLRLPTPRSREEAVRRGGDAVTTGIAELLDAVPRGARVAVFDTVVAGVFAGSAAKDAEKRLRRRGVTVLARESFTVRDNALVDGEIARAEQWGASLA